MNEWMYTMCSPITIIKLYVHQGIKYIWFMDVVMMQICMNICIMFRNRNNHTFCGPKAKIYECMYVMYACMHVCMHVMMHVCMNVCMYAWTYARFSEITTITLSVDSEDTFFLRIIGEKCKTGQKERGWIPEWWSFLHSQLSGTVYRPQNEW